MIIQISIQDDAQSVGRSIVEVRIGEWLETWLAQGSSIELVKSKELAPIIQYIVAKYKSDERLT